MSHHLLNIVIFTPLAFAAVVALLPSSERNQLRAVALVGSLVSFATTIALYAVFDASAGAPELQFELNRPWIASLGVGYHVGVDGLAASLILLTGLLGPIVVLSTWSAVQTRVKELYLALLVLQTAMYGTFAALDLALFYVFWELMLVPMYLLIGVWGSENRVYAAVKFFLYTFAGSVLMLVAILFLYVKSGAGDARTFDYVALLRALNDPDSGVALTWTARKWLFVAFALAFAVKVPVFPLHTWLPDAHVQAPAAGSIILAGVLLKMGAFGFLRYAMPLFPDAAAWARPTLIALAVVGIVYGSLMALAQKDLKKLVAYSSVAHLGFVMLGILAMTVSASTGAMYQMLNHGISTGALFLLVGLLYERTHTRAISDYGGIAKVVPMFAFAFMVIVLSSIGLPGTNGFVGELLILAGAFRAPFTAGAAAPGVELDAINMPLWTAVAATGVVLGAVYMLRMYQRVMFGPLRHQENRALADLKVREWLAVGPLLALVVVMGVMPQPFLDRLAPSAKRFVERVGGQSEKGVGAFRSVGVSPPVFIRAEDASRDKLIRPAKEPQVVRVADVPEPAVQPARSAQPAKPAVDQLPKLPVRFRDPKLLEAIKQRAKDFRPTP
ncbi:MAG: complex I subunit 4 family protein [Myxococcales bacterium]|jgi:NADH-quinone oxidoreductase subunit M